MYRSYVFISLALFRGAFAVATPKCPVACTNQFCFIDTLCATLWPTVSSTVTSTSTETDFMTITSTETDFATITSTSTETDFQTVTSTETDAQTVTSTETDFETITSTDTAWSTITDFETVTNTVHDAVTTTIHDTIYTGTTTITRPTVTKTSHTTTTVTATVTYNVPCSPNLLTCANKMTAGSCTPGVDSPRCSGKQWALTNPAVGTWKFGNCGGVTVCAAKSNGYKCVDPEFSECGTGSIVSL